MSERLDKLADAQGAETPELFPVLEGLSPLNDYFSFAPEDRRGVMAALQLGTTYLPTSRDWYEARQTWGGEGRLVWMYGNLADAYAFSVDPTFTADQINGDSKTAENRRKFYSMIDMLTAEQVDKGIRRILQYESSQATSQAPAPTPPEQ